MAALSTPLWNYVEVTPECFVQCKIMRVMFMFSFNSVISFFVTNCSISDTYYILIFDTNRDLPWFCPGSFYSVRLVPSVCHSIKFAPILSRENMHLLPFEFEFFYSPFPLLSLKIVFVSSLDSTSCISLRLYLNEIAVAWLLFQARTLARRSPSALDTNVVRNSKGQPHWNLNAIKR